mmetsp:Transcript_15350/g.25946  ORF Transcript_15350/g.25946 Transcript_15350/m.25946 type:complete len:291 (+) Transcript_15350:1829-2701(+)
MASVLTMKPMPLVFEDMFTLQKCDESFKQLKTITFAYHDESTATIIISNNEKKVRIQTDRFHQQWLVIRELVSRLHENYRGKEIYDIVNYDHVIPLNELFEVIEDHFRIRSLEQQLKKQIESRTVQFRMIQKRLLNRFKDKNPSPLNNLDFLLNHTYDQIIESALQIEKLRKEKVLVAQILSNTVEVMLMLLRVKARIAQDQFEILRQYFSPNVDDESQTGWEEQTLSSLLHLQRSFLVPGNMKQSQVPVNTKMWELTDVSKLLGNIQKTFDRLIQMSQNGEQIMFTERL